MNEKQTKKSRKKKAVQINFCQKNVECAKSVNHSQNNIFLISSMSNIFMQAFTKLLILKITSVRNYKKFTQEAQWPVL
jgi:hypothetical protein